MRCSRRRCSLGAVARGSSDTLPRGYDTLAGSGRAVSVAQAPIVARGCAHGGDRGGDCAEDCGEDRG